MKDTSIWATVCIALMAMLFGAYALFLGHNSVIIASVIGFLGTMAGYIYGTKTKEERSEESA